MFLGSIISLIFHKKFNVHREVVVFGGYQKFFFLESHSRKQKHTQVNHIIVKY